MLLLKLIRTDYGLLNTGRWIVMIMLGLAGLLLST